MISKNRMGDGFFLGASVGCLFTVIGALLFSRHKFRTEAILREKLVRAEVEGQTLHEKLAELRQLQVHFSDSFKALAAEALKNNNQSFLDLAQSVLGRAQVEQKGDLEKKQQAIDALIKPIHESLNKVDEKIQNLEKVRIGAYEGLRVHLQQLMETQQHLRSETSNLVKALRSPVIRGRWGEIQLRRVVEMSGMLDHCDFYEQKSIDTEEGRLRPDLVVRLPGNKNIVVDAKAPLSAYLEATEAQTDEERTNRLREHARQIRTHMTQLSRKSYWDQIQPAPEFVVLFLPGEMFFSAALEQDPALIEAGVEQRVILATPTTLIALLRAVSYGWRQENIAENAMLISELGKELYKRIFDMNQHLLRLGNHLQQSVESFNKTVGTFDSRVVVTARKFKELKTVPDGIEIESVPLIEKSTREISQTSIP